MIRKIASFVILVVLSGGTIGGYFYFYRLDKFNREFAGEITLRHKRIVQAYRKKLSDSGSASALQKIIKAAGEAELIAVTDRDQGNIVTVRSEAGKKENGIIDSIISNITSGRIAGNGNLRPKTEYYQTKENKMVRYYILSSELPGKYIFTAYPYKLKRRMIIRGGVEGLIILLFYIIIFSIVTVKRSSTRSVMNKRVVLQDNGKRGKPSSSTESYEYTLSDFPHDDQAGLSETKTSVRIAVSNSLNDDIYTLFSKLYNSFMPKNIALYLKSSQAELSKSYELNGKSFLKIDSPDFDIRPVSLYSGYDFNTTAGIMLNNGGTFIMPFLYNDELLGILEINVTSPLSQEAVRAISRDVEHLSGNIARVLSQEGRVLSEGITSSDSQMAGAQRDTAHSESTLVMISPAGGAILSLDEKKALFSLILPTVKEQLEPGDTLTEYRDMLLLTLPGNTQGGKTYRRVMHTISRFRVTLPQGRRIRLTPEAESVITKNSKQDSAAESLYEKMAG